MTSISKQGIHTSTNPRTENLRYNDFELNLDRAIARKLQAAKRQANIIYKFTGGGITGEADAVSFELLKNALIYYYQQLNSENNNITVKTVQDQDKKRSCYQHDISYVHRPNPHLYIVSILHNLPLTSQWERYREVHENRPT